MNPIQHQLKSFMENDKFKRVFEMQKEELLKFPPIQQFLMEHPELTEDQLDRSLMKLYEYKSALTNCRNCPGLGQCPNLLQGYEPFLFSENEMIGVSYDRCSLKCADDEKRKQQALMQSLFMPREILEASFKNLDLNDPHRSEAIEAAVDFAESYIAKKTTKGLYLYGKFGVGKTYIMGAIAHELAASKNVASLIVYAPDFFREMKNAIQDQSFQAKMDMVKQAPVLIFDDIGAETISSWIRDDVFGVILQYRMMEKLPTLYTSNFDFDELEEHLSYSQKGGVEELKAKRIMERIKHLTIPVFVGGENRRENG